MTIAILYRYSNGLKLRLYFLNNRLRKQIVGRGWYSVLDFYINKKAYSYLRREPP